MKLVTVLRLYLFRRELDFRLTSMLWSWALAFIYPSNNLALILGHSRAVPSLDAMLFDFMHGFEVLSPDWVVTPLRWAVGRALET